MLAILGIVNIFLAQCIRKSSKPIWTFYLFSETVVLLRVILFMDVFVDYDDATYAVILVVMPSYLYLMVGLSQVMLNVESIIKYKNFKIKEEEAITPARLKEKIAKNRKVLEYSYVVLYALMLGTILTFIVVWACYLSDYIESTPGTAIGAIYLALLNIVVWIMLALSTLAFISMLNKRFGEAEFTGPKCRLIFFLSVFSLSFFVRGTYDLVATLKEHPPDDQTNWGRMAAMMFTLYFFTEWLPIFSIYLTHLMAFQSLLNRNKK